MGGASTGQEADRPPDGGVPLAACSRAPLGVPAPPDWALVRFARWEVTLVRPADGPVS